MCPRSGRKFFGLFGATDRSLRNQKRVKYGDQQQNYGKSSCLTLKAERKKRKKVREMKKKSQSVPELSPMPSDPCTQNDPQSPSKSQSVPSSQVIRNQQILESLMCWYNDIF